MKYNPGDLTTIYVHTDAGVKGEKAAIGFIMLEPTEGGEIILCKEGRRLKEPTTSVGAEYQAVVVALQQLIRMLGKRVAYTTVELFSDAKNVVNHLNGQATLQSCRTFWAKVRRLVEKFAQVTFTWIPRAKNVLADRLVKEALA